MPYYEVVFNLQRAEAALITEDMWRQVEALDEAVVAWFEDIPENNPAYIPVERRGRHLANRAIIYGDNVDDAISRVYNIFGINYWNSDVGCGCRNRRGCRYALHVTHVYRPTFEWLNPPREHQDSVLVMAEDVQPELLVASLVADFMVKMQVPLDSMPEPLSGLVPHLISVND